jgi:membrane protease subunit (stomatin/prohibitin family)
MAVIDIVKYNGSPDVFAWKYPSDELGTWTQIIVNESQEAVLFKSGKALDVFGSGRHTLETANIPLLNQIVNLPFGGRSPFTAEVWFINKLHSLDIKWGTPTPIQLQDPKYGVFAPVRSFGQFGIKIEDSKKFLVKLVGTLPVFDQNNLIKYFRGLYITRVKDAISSYLVHKQISILEINAYLDEISDYMKEKLEVTLMDYGISILNFYVNDINIPEDDPAVKKLKDALAKRAEMNIIGYSYQQERSFDTLEGAATNPSSNQAGIMGAGLGLGMGVSMGGVMGGQFGGIAHEVNVNRIEFKECPNCHTKMEKSKRFCADCGYDTNKPTTDKSSEIVCSSCGNSITTTSKFCPECGKKYNPCPKCGADLAEGATKCDTCGYEAASACPNCNQPLEGKNLKFCPECGYSLVKKCPKCEAMINGSPKFCPECGEKL